jgi:predicted transcriptional regulator
VSARAIVDDMAKPTVTRVNVILDEERAAKLQRMADRTHISPGTLARSILSTALDEADPDARDVVALLDAIPGGWDGVREGAADARAGRFVPLDDL